MPVIVCRNWALNAAPGTVWSILLALQSNLNPLLEAPNTALLLTHTQRAPTPEPCRSPCLACSYPGPVPGSPPHFIQASHQIPSLREVTPCHSLSPALPHFLHGSIHYVLILSSLPSPAFDPKLIESRDFLFTAQSHVARTVPGMWLVLSESLQRVYILKAIWQYLVKLSM